jgi:hypothetical protein
MVIGVTPRPSQEGDGTFFLTEDLAHRWHMTPAAVATKRHRDERFPKAIQIGKRNLYRRRDVEAYEAAREEQ